MSKFATVAYDIVMTFLMFKPKGDCNVGIFAGV